MDGWTDEQTNSGGAADSTETHTMDDCCGEGCRLLQKHRQGRDSRPRCVRDVSSDIRRDRDQEDRDRETEMGETETGENMGVSGGPSKNHPEMLIILLRRCQKEQDVGLE